MKAEEIIREIKADFTEIRSGASEQAIRLTIQSIVRNINRLNLLLKKRSPALIKIAADIKSLHDSQLAFLKMNPPGNQNEKFDEGFFRSLRILKEELFTLLENIAS